MITNLKRHPLHATPAFQIEYVLECLNLRIAFLHTSVNRNIVKKRKVHIIDHICIMCAFEFAFLYQ